jgi:hypothetical protein
MGEAVSFLEKLSYGEQSTPGLDASFAEWDRKTQVNQVWYPSRRKGRAKRSGMRGTDGP